MIRLVVVPIQPCPNCGSDDIVAGHIMTSFPKKWFCECKECHWCGKTKITLLGAQISWNKQKKVKQDD